MALTAARSRAPDLRLTMFFDEGKFVKIQILLPRASDQSQHLDIISIRGRDLATPNFHQIPGPEDGFCHPPLDGTTKPHER